MFFAVMYYKEFQGKLALIAGSIFPMVKAQSEVSWIGFKKLA